MFAIISFDLGMTSWLGRGIVQWKSRGDRESQEATPGGHTHSSLGSNFLVTRAISRGAPEMALPL